MNMGLEKNDEEEIQLGVRMKGIYDELQSWLCLYDIKYVKSKIADYLIVKAKVSCSLNLEEIQELCNVYLCRAKIVTNYKDATITFYDEPEED